MSFIMGFQGTNGILITASVDNNIGDIVQSSEDKKSATPLIISRDGSYCYGVIGSGRDPSFLESELSQVYGSTKRVVEEIKRYGNPLHNNKGVYDANAYLFATGFNGSSLISAFSFSQQVLEMDNFKAIGPKKVLDKLSKFLPNDVRGLSLSDLGEVAEVLMDEIKGEYNGENISNHYMVHITKEGISVQNPKIFTF